MAFGPSTLDLSYWGAMMNVSNVCTGFRLGGFCALARSEPPEGKKVLPMFPECYPCSRTFTARPDDGAAVADWV